MKILTAEQGTIDWAEARRGLCTASRANDVLTPKKAALSSAAFGYACELLAERLVPPHYWISDDFAGTRAMLNGTNTEREARAYFEFVTGLTVAEVGLCVSDDGFFGASPDGLVGDDAGLELKCPLHKTQVKWLLNGGVPDEHRWQIHGGMIVTGRRHWWFMSYAVGLAPLLLRVDWNEDTEKLAAAWQAFKVLFDDLEKRLASLGDPVAALRQPVEVYF